ncbi:MAG: c-type cytochrome [Candidatus Dadabacteria bacterium]|nr:c-type cytochrome [Candidatus Dadabacteria bacterium]
MTLRKTALLALAAVALMPGYCRAFPWSLDMWVQPSSDPYEKPVLHPQKSVSVNAAPAKSREETEAIEKSPVPATAASIKRGKDLYKYNCVSCHGLKGLGDGLIITKGHGFYPVNLTAPGVVARTDGYLYAYIMYGGKVMMPAYAENMPVQGDAWHIVNYVRNLQEEVAGPKGKQENETNK